MELARASATYLSPKAATPVSDYFVPHRTKTDYFLCKWLFSDLQRKENEASQEYHGQIQIKTETFQKGKRKPGMAVEWAATYLKVWIQKPVGTVSMFPKRHAGPRKEVKCSLPSREWCTTPTLVNTRIIGELILKCTLFDLAPGDSHLLGDFDACSLTTPWKPLSPGPPCRCSKSLTYHTILKNQTPWKNPWGEVYFIFVFHKLSELGRHL